MLVIIFIILASMAGYRNHSLSVSGSFAAVLTGSAVYAGFGWKGLFLLGLFFVTSSYWSKYKASLKKGMEEKTAKGSARDWRQVLANGGTAAAFSLIFLFTQNVICLIGFTVSIASANSDTWASEIGSLSTRKPIYIRTFKPIEPGTSGAISLLGSMAAVGGSLLIAVFSTWLFSVNFFIGIIIFLFGYLGNVIDTFFGAYYQQLYVCKKCGIETEKSFHCEMKTVRIKGHSFVDNDMVNFLSGLLAAISAICITIFI